MATGHEHLELQLRAKANFLRLSKNQYPGRIIIAGLDETGKNLVQGYAIMGRSENSRNRVFGRERGRLFTEAADPSKVKDPSLIIYNAMCEVRNNDITYAVVSNGSQTDAIVKGYENDQSFHVSIRDPIIYEPDHPNFTPRISASCYWPRPPHDSEPVVEMSLLRKSPWSDKCDRHFYKINGFGPGFGYCLTTYSGDGSPLPSFQGEPYLLPLLGDVRSIADIFWEALNADNRVSLAVKFIPKTGPSEEIVIINKYSKIG
jgi:hypothetical protein